MSPPLSWAIESNDRRLVVTVRGQLDLTSVGRLRVALLRCLAEQPDGMLVDLSAMTVSGRTVLSVFTAVVRQATIWPGTPVMLCAAAPEVAAHLDRGRFGRLPVAPTFAGGASRLTDARLAMPAISSQLLPVVGAARRARAIIAEACARWQVEHLVTALNLVTSELVNNAVQHAGTAMTLRLSLRGGYLHIAVRDGSTAAPVRRWPAMTDSPGGRGLQIVESVAAQWGVLPSHGGKVVWAALAADLP